MAKFKVFFGGIADAVATYRDDSTRIVKSYKNSLKANNSRYQSETAETENAHALEDHFNELSDAFDRLKRNATLNIDSLAKSLDSWANEAPSSDFMNRLSVYSTFDLKASEAELNGLLRQSEGNRLALRVLQSIAERSGYSIEGLEPLDSLESDLEEIRRNVDSLRFCIPSTDSDSMNLLPKTRMWHGVEYPIDSMSVAINLALAENLPSKLEKMAARWEDSVQLGKADAVRIAKADPSVDSTSLLRTASGKHIAEEYSIPEVEVQNRRNEANAPSIVKAYTGRH